MQSTIPDQPDSVLALRGVSMLTAHMAETHLIVSRYMSEFDAGVSAWVDGQPHRRRSALRRIQSWSVDVISALAMSTFDHTRTLVLTLQPGPHEWKPVWAQMTLARAVVESGVRFAALTDQSLAPEVRFLRCAAAYISGREEERKLGNDFDDEESRGHIEAIEDEMVSHLTRGGLEFVVDSRQHRTGVRYLNESVSLRMNITQEASVRMPLAVSPYRAGSAATHGAWWYLASSIEMGDGKAHAKASPDTTIAAVSMCLESLNAMAAACDAGSEGSDALKKATLRRSRIMLNAGGRLLR